MRVGLTVYGTLDERSGGFRYDRKLVEQFRRAGDTVETVELPWRAYHHGLLDNVRPGFRDRLDVDVDVMLQDELAHPSLVYTNRHLQYPIVTVVHHLRASEPRRLSGVYRAVERRYLASVDAAVCNSTVTHDVVTGLGVDTESTVVAPPAGDRFDPDIDPAEIEDRARRRPLQIVFVGNISPRKGLDTLVDGLARADTDAKLIVVGRPVDEGYADAVRRRIADYELDSRVKLTGELSDSELARILRDSHVLAVPSRYEGFGIVYLEGMSFGLPAIASGAGGATDIVTDGETGIIVDPDDPAAIAEAVTRLGTDIDRLSRMGQQARERYETHPDWATTASRVRELLATVASPTEVTV